MNEKIKPVMKIIDSFRFKTNRAELLSDIFSIVAYCISNQVDRRSRDKRERYYLDIMSKYSKEDIKLLANATAEIMLMCSECTIDRAFNDYLGELYMESMTSSAKAGQFFTPFNVSRLTAMPLIKKATEDLKTEELTTLDEPACGSGGLILAFAEGLFNAGINYSEKLFVHASDLDERCVKMCYIQLSLAGIPAIIHHRDTLTMKTFDAWYTPAYCFNYLKFRRFEGTL